MNNDLGRFNKIDGKRVDVLIKNLEILENHCFLDIKIIYDVSFATISSLVIVAVYSYINNQLSLIIANPFIIFTSGLIYLHLSNDNLKLDAYAMDIEDEISNLLKSDVMCQVHDFGAISKEVKANHQLLLLSPFILGYLFFFLYGIYYVGKDKGWLVAGIFCIVFIILAIYLIVTGVLLRKKQKRLYEKHRTVCMINKYRKKDNL